MMEIPAAHLWEFDGNLMRILISVEHYEYLNPYENGLAIPQSESVQSAISFDHFPNFPKLHFVLGFPNHV